MNEMQPRYEGGRYSCSFSAEDDETIIRMAGDGKSASQIGLELGRTRNSIIGRCHRAGIQLAGSRPLSQKPHARRARARAELKRANLPPRPPRVAQPKIVHLPKPRKKPMYESIPESEIVFVGKTIVELRRYDCKWPQGDPTKDNFRYCGAPAQEGKPYCSGHCHISYEAPRRRAA